jgi:DNA-binding transcriptional regulator YhcF (GntR family)
VKSKLAQEQMRDFLKNMKQLGFENKEILSMLKTMLEEVKQ